MTDQSSEARARTFDEHREKILAILHGPGVRRADGTLCEIWAAHDIANYVEQERRLAGEPLLELRAAAHAYLVPGDASVMADRLRKAITVSCDHHKHETEGTR